MSIRLGIIGAGGIARQHAASATAAGSVVAAACDVIPERAEALAAAYPGADALTDLNELLGRDDIDAVVVTVPNHLHKPVALAVLDAGKDMLLEKPMALDVAECDDVLAACAASDRIVQLGFVSRYAPTVCAVRALIDAGRLGRIYHARAQLYRRRGIPGLGGWFTRKAQSGGGVLIDLGVHLIDLVMDLTGRPVPERVSGVCTSTFGDPIAEYAFEEMWSGPPRPDGVFDVEDAASGLVRFAGGLAMQFTVTWAANVSEELLPGGVVLLGERGGCCFDVWGDRIRLATEEDGRLLDLVPRLPAGDAWPAAWQREHEVFAEAVTTRTPPAASPAHGRAVQGVVDAVYRSSAQGREVEVG